MSIEVKSELFIEKSPEDVAQVMFNPKLDKLWIRGLKATYPMASGLYTKGAKVERVGNFLSKHYSAKLLVTKFEENKFVQMYADEPFEMAIKYRLNETDGGTNVQLSISSIGEILFNTPMSIISKSLQEILDEDLERLKEHLEDDKS